MKRLLVIVTMFCAIHLSFNAASAQEPRESPEPLPVADLFTWATSTPPDWSQAAMLFDLGCVGALVTIFGLIGGAVPGTAGQPKIDENSARLDRLYERL